MQSCSIVDVAHEKVVLAAARADVPESSQAALLHPGLQLTVNCRAVADDGVHLVHRGCGKVPMVTRGGVSHTTCADVNTCLSFVPVKKNSSCSRSIARSTVCSAAGVASRGTDAGLDLGLRPRYACMAN